MELQLLILWYFKLPFEIKKLDSCHASTENPEFGNGRVDGRFKHCTGMKPMQF